MIEDHIYNLTGLDQLKRATMSRYFGRISEDERVETVKLAYDLAKQNMEKADETIRGKPIFFYGMLCLSAWKLKWTREVLSQKNPNLTPRQAKEITERRIEGVFAVRRDRVKRGRLKTLMEIRLFHVVKELRSKGVSWREVSVYLKKYHKTQISFVHLRKLYERLTLERKLRGEE